MPLPNQGDSFKFAVLGNAGTGEQAQYDLADQMAALRERFKYDVVLLLGDNIQGSERPQDFLKKFEVPYKRLLEAGVSFHAVLGNEDSREQPYYKNFNMKGALHYTFEPRPDVQFIALESTYLEPKQVEWLDATLKSSKSAWKIVYLHHPLYSSGRRHGSHEALRHKLEPLFLTHKVSVVLSAHDNMYERTKPQNDITYFVVGSVGKGAPGRNRPEQRADRERVRRGSGVSGRRDRRRSDVFQHHLPHGADSGFWRAGATEIGYAKAPRGRLADHHARANGRRGPRSLHDHHRSRQAASGHDFGSGAT